MTLMLTCAEVTDHLTDFMEGATPFSLRWRMRTHLSLCPGCKAFLESLRQLPLLVRTALAAEEEPPAAARAALSGALARLVLRSPTTQALAGGQPRPKVADLLAGDGSSDLLGLLQRTQAALHEGPLPTAPPYLPAEILQELPPQSAWSWWGLGLGGARLARVQRSGNGRQELFLLAMPPHCRFPLHGHGGAETLLVLQGGLEDGPRHGQPGDWFHHAEHPAEHAPVADATGCWALVCCDSDALRLQGWRGWVQRFLGFYFSPSTR